MFLFGQGFSEVSAIVGLVKDVAIILLAVNLVFKVDLGIVWTGVICFVSFWLFVLLGFVLKNSGMLDYGQMISNSINPQIRKIDEIEKKVDKLLQEK